MKKNVALFALILFSTSTFAANWKFAGMSKGSMTYIDINSVIQQGKLRKAWVMWDYGETQVTNDGNKFVFNSSKLLNWVDCETNQSGYTQIVNYEKNSGVGEIVSSHSILLTDSSFTDVIPGSIGETHLQIICSAQPKNTKKVREYKY